MQQFLLNHDTGFLKRVRNIVIAYVICWFWVYYAATFQEWIFGTHIALKDLLLQFPFKREYNHPIAVDFYLSCFLAPLWEELVFRHLPLQFAKRNTYLLLPIMLASAALFGWCHDKAPSLAIQGVSGFIFSVLYVRNGFHYWSSVFIHFLWNLVILFSIYYLPN